MPIQVKIAVIDCYDSFVYNLVEVLRKQRNCSFDVLPYHNLQATAHRSFNDNMQAYANALAQQYHGFLFSPGPGIPSEMPFLSALLRAAEQHASVLGVCLGHQAIAHHYGCTLTQLAAPLHGHQDRLINVNSERDFLHALKEENKVARYHSWVVQPTQLGKDIEVLAYAAGDNSIMALRHRRYPFYGVQFHPESYITTDGANLVTAWVNSLQEVED